MSPDCRLGLDPGVKAEPVDAKGARDLPFWRLVERVRVADGDQFPVDLDVDLRADGEDVVLPFDFLFQRGVGGTPEGIVADVQPVARRETPVAVGAEHRLGRRKPEVILEIDRLAAVRFGEGECRTTAHVDYEGAEAEFNAFLTER